VIASEQQLADAFTDAKAIPGKVEFAGAVDKTVPGVTHTRWGPLPPVGSGSAVRFQLGGDIRQITTPARSPFSHSPAVPTTIMRSLLVLWGHVSAMN